MSQLFQSSQSQVRGAEHTTTGTAERQKLAQLSPAQRAAFFERALLQRNAIYISPQGEFQRLERHLSFLWQLTVPIHEHDSLAAEAAQVFYSQNEFMVSIGTVPDFVAWRVRDSFRPSDLVTRLAVLFGPPSDPGGSLRLVYDDYKYKGRGPHGYLRPSFGAIIELKKQIPLKLQLRNSWPGTSVDGEESASEPLKDITSYLNPPTPAEIQIVEDGKKVLEEYRGYSASVANSLMECGWSEVASEEFIVLRWRAMITEWANDQFLAAQDVEMS